MSRLQHERPAVPQSQRGLRTEGEDPLKRPTNDEQFDEAGLVMRLRARDTMGMSILYDRYAPAVYGILLRMLRTEELAEDALQETFIKAWYGFDSYDSGKGRLFTWLVRVARNVGLDVIKSRGFRNSRKNQELESVVPFLDKQSSAGDDSDRIGLAEIVQALKPVQRELIDLIYFQGFTQEEAARALGIPLGTVKTRVRAAIHAIRKLFS